MLAQKWMVRCLIALCLVAGLFGLPHLRRQVLAQAPCPAGQECEPNNQFGAANVVAAPGQVQGSINPAGDSDWYVFTVATAGELQVTIADVAPELDINFRVWNGNKDVISGWFAPAGKGSSTTGVIDLPAPGAYALEVAAGDGGASSDELYTLQLGFTAAVDPFEPNNTFGAASAVSAGQLYQANILPVGDADWYSVEVQHPGELRVDISNVPKELDMNVRVWSANKETMSGWFAPLAKGGNTSGSVDLPVASRYYLEVADGNYDARSVQPYTLQLTFTASADNDEPNNVVRDATPLLFGQPHVATILPQGDVDWYMVQAGHQGELRVAVTGVPADLDIDYRVWNSNLDTISGWVAPLAKGGNTIGVIDLPAPGRYSIEMADGNNDARSIQPFTVTAVFTPTADPFEPNNDFGSASALQLDNPVQTNIFPQGDADWHYVEVPHQGRLTVTASSVPANLAIAVRLWNGNKDTISGWFLPLAPGGNTTAVVDVAAAGRYYLEIGDNANQGRSVQPFSLNVSFAPTADQGESNNTVQTATPITLDTSVAANILPVGDRDWYAFDITTPGQLQILATRVPPEQDINYRVWNSNNEVVGGWFGPLAKGGDTVASVDITAAGRYFLEVADGNDDTSSIQPYVLYLSMGPIDAARVTVPVAITPTVGLTATTGITATMGQPVSQ